MDEEYTEICGEVMNDLFWSENIHQLNLELAVTKGGAPIIVFENWKEDETTEVLFKLHLQEAIELKAVIDRLILNATLGNREHMEELMEGPERELLKEIDEKKK